MMAACQHQEAGGSVHHLENLEVAEVGGTQKTEQGVLVKCHNVFTVPAFQQFIWCAGSSG